MASSEGKPSNKPSAPLLARIKKIMQVCAPRGAYGECDYVPAAERPLFYMLAVGRGRR
jgi:hypothetical protein